MKWVDATVRARSAAQLTLALFKNTEGSVHLTSISPT
jgi:hypothetical protein